MKKVSERSASAEQCIIAVKNMTWRETSLGLNIGSTNTKGVILSYTASPILGFLIHKGAYMDNNLPQVVVGIKWENIHKTSDESDSFKL